MTLAEYSLTAFAALNGARIAAYVPQLRRIYCDPNGAAAVSIVTWTLFALANTATVTYALLVANDVLVAVIFSLNTIGCVGVAGLTVAKRFELGLNLWPIRRRKPAPRYFGDCHQRRAALARVSGRGICTVGKRRRALSVEPSELPP